jgi:hypothetical protein
MPERFERVAPGTHTQVAIPILIHEISTIAIPDINGDAGTPVGHVSYSISQIHVNSVNIPTSSIVLSPSGLTISLSGISIGMNAHWYETPHNYFALYIFSFY